MDLDTRLLRSFLTVASELNFSRAAQRLHMSQQALSAQIQRLETAVGSQLFVRTTRYVELTEAGHVLVRHAELITDRLGEVARDLAALRDGSGPRLRVGFAIGAALDLTAPILEEFSLRRPDVSVDLHEAPMSDPSAGLHKREVDAAFVRLPFQDGGLDHLELLRDPRVALVHQSHPLADRDSLSFADIADQPLLMTRTLDPVWDDFWLATDARDGARPPISHEVSTLDEELILIASRAAMSISVATAARWPHSGALRFIPIEDLEPSIIALAWPRPQDNPVIADLIAAAVAVREREQPAGGSLLPSVDAGA